MGTIKKIEMGNVLKIVEGDEMDVKELCNGSKVKILQAINGKHRMVLCEVVDQLPKIGASYGFGRVLKIENYYIDACNFRNISMYQFYKIRLCREPYYRARILDPMNKNIYTEEIIVAMMK